MEQNREPFRFEIDKDKPVPPALSKAVLSGRKIIGINPGAGHSSRRWSVENFIELADRLYKDGLYEIVVFLGPEEEAIAERFEAASKRAWTVD